MPSDYKRIVEVEVELYVNGKAAVYGELIKKLIGFITGKGLFCQCVNVSKKRSTRRIFEPFPGGLDSLPAAIFFANGEIVSFTYPDGGVMEYEKIVGIIEERIKELEQWKPPSYDP